MIKDLIIKIFVPDYYSLLDENLTYKKNFEQMKNEINTLRNNETEYIKQIQLLKQKEIEYINQINQQTQQINLLNEKLKEKQQYEIPEETQQLIDYYNKKYPTAEIAYTGRYFGSKPTDTYSLDVRVFAYAGINDAKLIDHVRRYRAFVKDIMKEKNIGFHEACDEAVLRIAKSTPILYQYDYYSYNTTEYWAFSFETYKQVYERKVGQDCDDYAHMRHVLFRIAGVPAGLVRVVCGDTKGNLGGHATNYYLKSDGEWYHINSTSTINSFDDWRHKDDPNDAIGIGSVWFSYNDEFSWHTFKTDASRESYFKNKDRLVKDIIIKGEE